MPATNAVSECSFSAMRHLRTYLRSTMHQSRFNYPLLLNINREKADQLNNDAIGDEFFQGSEDHLRQLGKFTLTFPCPYIATYCWRILHKWLLMLNQKSWSVRLPRTNSSVPSTPLHVHVYCSPSTLYTTVMFGFFEEPLSIYYCTLRGRVKSAARSIFVVMHTACAILERSRWPLMRFATTSALHVPLLGKTN